MSRTYRRTKDRWLQYEYVESWYNRYEHEPRHYCLPYIPKPKRLALYRGDRSDGYGHRASTSFRRDLNKDFRSRNKAILARILKEDRDYPFIPFIKNSKSLYEY